MDREAWRLIGGFGVGLVVGIGLFYAWPQVRSNTDLIPPKIEINRVNLRYFPLCFASFAFFVFLFGFPISWLSCFACVSFDARFHALRAVADGQALQEKLE